jgi:hypothetical protein
MRELTVKVPEGESAACHAAIVQEVVNWTVRNASALLACVLLLGGNGCGRPAQAREKRDPQAAQPKRAEPKAAEPARAVRKPRSAIGTNLEGLSDWSQDWASVDAFKLSRTWVSGSKDAFDDGRPIATDANGWVTSLAPGQIARTLMFWGGVQYPSGDYVVLYEGKGDFVFWPEHPVVASEPGRKVLRVDSKKGGIGIMIQAVDAADPLRNIRVIMPGGSCQSDPRRYCDEKTSCGANDRCLDFEHHYGLLIFHPRFLERVDRYGVVRFMDWMQTNGSNVSRWSDRPTPESARWTQTGAPLEAMVELANRLRQDAWFTIPHLADDDYVTKFAEYVRDHLSPERKVYVEHSNEVWNSQFPQAAFAAKRGQESGLGPSPFEAQLKYHARRTARIAKIWERVFAGHKNRLVRVLGAQAANPWTSEVMLAFEDVRAHTDALAIAPYFGGYLGTPEEHQRVAALSLDQLFEELRARALPETTTWIAQQARVAKAHNLPLIAYEGGQHMTGVGPAVDNAALNALFDRANRDPRMGEIYAAYLAEWRKQGGTLFMHFVDCAGPSKWGRWGALEWLEQPRAEAPKYDAIQRFIEQNPPWW